MIEIDELDDDFFTTHRKALAATLVAAAGLGIATVCRFHAPALAIEQHQRNPDVVHLPIVMSVTAQRP